MDFCSVVYRDGRWATLGLRGPGRVYREEKARLSTRLHRLYPLTARLLS